MENQKIKRNKNIFIYIGIIFIFISLCMIIYYSYNNIQNKKEENNSLDNYIIKTKIETDDTNNNIEVVEAEINEEPVIDYLMVLEIPKINIKKGIYDINSKYNSVSYNIQILKSSNMPSKENGNTIFASHNGNSSVSYFNNLNKLNRGDLINIYYDGYLYEYKLDNSYDIEKNGTAVIKRDSNKTTITLITCKKNTKDTQTVFIGYLNNKTKY